MNEGRTVFAQLTWRESLRDIETCLAALGPKLYHFGFRQPTARSTLADANEQRDWRLFADFAQVFITQATALYGRDPFLADLKATAYALDSTTIDLCRSLFPWAKFRQHKAAIKLHTLLTLQGHFSAVILVTPGNVHDVEVLDQLTGEAGSFYIMDRGYLDFARWHRLHQSSAFFVTRAKKNLRFVRRYSRPVDKTTVPALSIAQLNHGRWQIELFCKWIKQHLRLKAFYGTSPNAVRTQVWSAIAVYLLVAILKKRLHLTSSPDTILQILSLTVFEKTPIQQALAQPTHTPASPPAQNPQCLLGF